MKLGDIVQYADHHKHIRQKPERCGKIINILEKKEGILVHWEGNKKPQPSQWLHKSYLKLSKDQSEIIFNQPPCQSHIPSPIK